MVKREPKGRRVAIYLRVSTSEQSTDNQRRELDALARLNELHRAQRSDDSRLSARIESFELAYRMQGEAPEALEKLARQIRQADGFVFIVGEYNWGVQPGLKNLTDHFLEEWFWRPAAIASYSAGRFAGARAATAWHGTLSEMGMVVVSSTSSL